jgi:hypothetical protein
VFASLLALPNENKSFDDEVVDVAAGVEKVSLLLALPNENKGLVGAAVVAAGAEPVSPLVLPNENRGWDDGAAGVAADVEIVDSILGLPNRKEGFDDAAGVAVELEDIVGLLALPNEKEEIDDGAAEVEVIASLLALPNKNEGFDEVPPNNDPTFAVGGGFEWVKPPNEGICEEEFEVVLPILLNTLLLFEPKEGFFLAGDCASVIMLSSLDDCSGALLLLL